MAGGITSKMKVASTEEINLCTVFNPVEVEEPGDTGHVSGVVLPDCKDCLVDRLQLDTGLGGRVVHAALKPLPIGYQHL